MGVFSVSNRIAVTEVGVSEWRCREFKKTFGCSLGMPPGMVLVAVSTAKDAILRCFLPSKTTKSSCFRSATAPFLSWTTTLTCTRRVLERMTAGTPDWVPDWATARPAERRLPAAKPGAASAFSVRSQLPFEPVCPPPVRRYGVKQEPIVRHPGWIHGTGPQKTRQPCQGKVEMSYSQQSRNVLF